jgi:LPXTG-motif cell wall-anchored protein
VPPASRDYDFTFGWETDTQYYNDTHPEHQLEIHDFFLNQRQNLNLRYVFHTGDVVDKSDDLHQWQNATAAYTLLDNAKLPYGIVSPGSPISIELAGHAGETVNVWLHSDPRLLGTVEVGTAGFATVTVPMDAPLGTHRIVVQAANGSLIGWDGIQIVAPAPAALPSTDEDALASTGLDASIWMAFAGLLLALGAATLTVKRRRSRTGQAASGSLGAE